MHLYKKIRILSVASTLRTKHGFVSLGHVGFQLEMQPVTCNKCKSGKPSPGDSWCLACSSQEVTLELAAQVLGERQDSSNR
jgi:hypothetical protein